MEMMTPNDLLAALRWRYAVKKFDAGLPIAEPTWAALEESLVLSSSSFGLQPWKFFVIDSPELRKQLLPHSWGQSQIVEAAKLVVFALKNGVGPADAERLIARTAEVRGVPAASLEGYKKVMVGTLQSKQPHEIDTWMTNQVYIALGHFLTAAAVLGIDACPMEGFVPAKYNEVLGLTAKGYHAVVVAGAGHRAADDKYAAVPKVRFPAAEVVERL